jgi:hypothetical protein
VYLLSQVITCLATLATFILHPFSVQVNNPQSSSKEPEAIITDRPDFTESAVVIPFKSLQIEGGATYAPLGGMRSLSGPEMLLRFGAAKKFEWRLGLPDYHHARFGGRTLSGFGDAYLGFKHQIGPLGGVDLAIIGALTAPSGGSHFTSGGWDPEVAIPFSKNISQTWEIGGQVTLAFPTESGRRLTVVTTTLTLGRDISRQWGVFFEYAGDFPNRGGPGSLFHTGFTFGPDIASQLDMHVAIGLNRNTPGYLIGVGFAVRR